MNDRLTKKILSDAQAALQPTQSDRNRMNRRIMGAVGAATVATAATTGAAKSAGWLGSVFGIPAGVVTIAKVTAGGLLISGIIALGVARESFIQTDNETLQQAQNVSPSEKHSGTAVQQESYSSIETNNVESTLRPNGENETIDTAVEPTSSVSNEQLEGAPPSKSNDIISKSIRKTTPHTPPSNNAPLMNDDALLHEIGMIKSASRAVQEKNYSAAFELLRNHQEKYPNGTMQQERDGLYISALCGSGQVAVARVEIEKFTRMYRKPPIMFMIDEQCMPTNKLDRADEK